MLPSIVDIVMVAPVSIDAGPVERMLKAFDHPRYTFKRVLSIADAQEFLEEQTPQLILAHSANGEANLLSFIKHLTSQKIEVPIVIIAPRESMIDDNACLQAGAHGFIVLESTAPVQCERHIRFILSNTNIQHRLKQMLETRDHFLSLLAHDLRGPLGILYSGFKIYHERFHKTEPARMERFLLNAKNQTQDILELTQRILSWASAHDENIRSHPKIIQLHKSTKENLKAYDQALREKNLQVEINIDPQIQIIADPDMWDTIVRNFLYNAIKFSLPNHSIILKGTILPESNLICFSITDQGVGMTQKQISQLLESSGPVDTRRGTKNEKGNGLGIQICTQYIRLMKGSLKIDSEKGKGTRIQITIPQAQELVECS